MKLVFDVATFGALSVMAILAWFQTPLGEPTLQTASSNDAPSRHETKHTAFIDEPQDMTRVNGYVVVKGRAKVFGKHINIRLRNVESGNVLLSETIQVLVPNPNVYGQFNWSFNTAGMKPGTKLAIDVFEQSRESANEIGFVTKIVEVGE